MSIEKFWWMKILLKRNQKKLIFLFKHFKIKSYLLMIKILETYIMIKNKWKNKFNINNKKFMSWKINWAKWKFSHKIIFKINLNKISLKKNLPKNKLQKMIKRRYFKEIKQIMYQFKNKKHYQEKYLNKKILKNKNNKGKKKLKLQVEITILFGGKIHFQHREEIFILHLAEIHLILQGEK